MRQLPAQRARAELRRAAVDRRRGDPRALGVEGVARAEPDEQPPPPVGVVQREVLERGARLAGLEQRGERGAVEVVRDPLVVEDADRDGVGARRRGGVGGDGGAHRPRRLRD
jgi:hypothetical protein